MKIGQEELIMSKIMKICEEELKLYNRQANCRR